MADPIIQVFYEEYTDALSFLESKGYSKHAIDGGLVQRLVYLKESVAFYITLEVREVYVDCSVRVSNEDGFEEHGVPIANLLTPDELQSPEMSELSAEVRRLYENKKFYRRVLEGREVDAARLIFQKDAQWLSIVFRKYEETIVTRALEGRFRGNAQSTSERPPSQPKPIGLIENAQPHHAFDCPTFHQLVEHYFAFLHQHGFQRRPDLDDPNTPTCTCVFAGQHIGIMVYLSQPAPDWWHASGHPHTANIYVGVNVVRLRDYQQRNLERYFVGIEGLVSDVPVSESVSPVEREVVRWAELLKRYGQQLLADREDSWELG